jgi:hypothetical protein
MLHDQKLLSSILHEDEQFDLGRSRHTFWHYIVCTGRKCAVLVNRSTITQMESYLKEVLGKPTIKSILISSHFQEGIDRGWRIPVVFKWLALTLWQTSHSETYLAISRFIRVQQKFCFRSWYIFVLPGCIENLDRWASSNICLRSLWSLGTTIRSLNHEASPHQGRLKSVALSVPGGW